MNAIPIMKNVGKTVPAVSIGCHEGNLLEDIQKSILNERLKRFLVTYLCCLKFESKRWKNCNYLILFWLYRMLINLPDGLLDLIWTPWSTSAIFIIFTKNYFTSHRKTVNRTELGKISKIFRTLKTLILLIWKIMNLSNKN